MKKFILGLLIISSIGTFSTEAKAGWYSSYWLEPATLCVVGGVVGMSKDATTAGLYCVGGLAVGYAMNQYWRKKVDIVHENKIQELRDEVKIRVVRQAEKANLGLVDDYYALEAEQVEEAQEQPDGSVISPTKKIILKAP